ncbi:hypothetical protein ZHAS_00019723 [Anopheles sinensis]|uniref:C-type lectin domain-containing protein n=1 Tax=Anopheles sinensis TaxID=74873 RepID=A0A084WN51_ANOSI|nr:hypothetical protein ZHAS_00019723 [Anopheles sinensis]
MTKLHVFVVTCVAVALQAQLSLQYGDNSFAWSRQKEYYFGSRFKLNWFKAVEYCRDRGMFLLSVRNAEEREAIINYLASIGYTKRHKGLWAWMSANDLGEEGEFHWASTGGPVDYQNWSETEPNNYKTNDCRGEDCAILEYWEEGGANFNFTFNDRDCYTKHLNWHKAVEYCRTRGMFLVSINNAEELDGVVDYIEKSGFSKTHGLLHMWTSANDLGEEGQFFLASTGQRLTFDRWTKNEPNNAKHDNCTFEHCVVLEYYLPLGINYTFDDRPCNAENFFMCETIYD